MRIVGLVEGFVPEECNYPAVRRLLINVILFIAAYCGRSYMCMYQAKT